MNKCFLLWLIIHIIATPFNMYFFPKIGLLTIFVLALSFALWVEATLVSRMMSGELADRFEPCFLPIVPGLLVEVVTIYQYATY